MNISIICVGKIKEKFYRGAIEEYSKRLRRYCKLDIIEVSDEKTPDNASIKEEIQIKDKEGEAILKNIKDNMYVIVMDINGEMITSELLAKKIRDLGVFGHSDIAFVIGGSLGLAKAVLEKADYKLSFSRMTFPHQLFRVMILEQVYRGFKINSGEPYHK